MPSVLLMENAARSAVDAITARYGDMTNRVVGVLCGGGNNGGDGYAIARLLANRGANVTLYPVAGPHRGDAKVMAEIATRMKLPSVEAYPELPAGISDCLWIDAIYGTGVNPVSMNYLSALVEQLNSVDHSVVAIDVPSGLDCDTGLPAGEKVIRASLTVSFVAEKVGYADERSRYWTGDIVVGDIGCPREIIDRVAKIV